ncbi:MAG: WG repeat-containing protein [Thiotrichaceae bacterium]
MGVRAVIKYNHLFIKIFFVFATLISGTSLANPEKINKNLNSDTVFQAVMRSDEAMISRYLLTGGDKEVLNRVGMTPLAVAVQLDKKVLIDLLLAKGADIKAKDNNGRGLLHLVASLSAARLLLSKGVALNDVDKEGNTALHTTGSKNIAAFLIAKGLSINTRNNKGRTALHVASALGNYKTVQFLLDSYADVNVRDQYGKTPLFLSSQLAITRLLLNKGANVSAKDSLGQTALHRATDKEVILALLKNGANVSSRDFEGRTPLHTAALVFWNTQDVAQVLLSYGADLESRDLQGRTPLHRVDSVEIATFLLQQGARPYVKDNQARTPLQLATLRSNKEIVALLSKKQVSRRSKSVTTVKSKPEPIDRNNTSATLQQKLDEAIALKLENQDKEKHQNQAGPPKPELTAELVIPPTYESAGSFHKGSAPVRVEGKWGLIDKTGEWILAPTFTEIGKYTEEGLLPVKVDGKYGYIDSHGTPVTPFEFDDVKPFSEGLAAVKIEDQWGYILPDGKIYITAGYEDAGLFKEGVAPVKLAEGWGYALREWGEGVSGKNWLLEPFFQRTYEFSEGHGVIKFEHKMGLVDLDKNIVIKPSYLAMKKYSEGLLPVQKQAGKWYFVDNQGNTVIAETFQNVSSFSEGLASVKKKDKWGYINKHNEVVIPFEFDRAYDFREGVAVVVKDENRFFIDQQGRPLSDQYEDVYRISEGYAAVKMGGLWGYVYIPLAAADKESGISIP